MHHRHSYRLLAIIAMLAMISPAWGSTVASQATPEATAAGEDVITGQRLDALPLGETGQAGDVAIVVTGFNQDASALANPESTYVVPANRTIVNIEVALTNNGTDPFDAATIGWLTAGNRGLLLSPSSTKACAVDNNVLSFETVVIAPGETATGNICTAVLTGDVDSLQLLVLETGEGVDSGTWFNLGAPEGFDPSIGEAAAAAARDGAVQGTRDAPANSSDTALAGNLAFTQVEYLADAAADMLAFDPMASVSDGVDTAYTVMDVVNVGTTSATAGMSLFDGSGIGSDSGSIPNGFRDVTGAGILLPGGSARIHGAWQSSPETAAERVFRLASGSDVSWMLAADGNAPAWDLLPTDLASAAPADAASPVPYGQTASVAGLNLTLSPGGAYPHTLTMAVADAPPDGDSIWLTLAYGDDWTEQCSFVTEYGASTSFSGSFSSIVLPGANRVFDISCDDGGATPLTASVQQGGNEEVIGIFARSGDVQAQPAGDSADAGSETAPEPAADQPADAVPAEGDTAMVIAASANVRAEPTTAGTIVAVLAAGDAVTITGEGVVADGYTWLPVTLADGTTGWIAEQLIQRG